MPNHLKTSPVTTIDKRNRRQRDERRAEVEQEQKQDDDDQDAAVAQRVDDVVDAQFDEALLLVDFGIDADVGRQRRP